MKKIENLKDFAIDVTKKAQLKNTFGGAESYTWKSTNLQGGGADERLYTYGKYDPNSGITSEGWDGKAYSCQ